MSNEISKQKDSDVRSLIEEAVKKLVNGIIGTEQLHGITIDDFEWMIKMNDGKTYQVYFEKFKGEQK